MTIEQIKRIQRIVESIVDKKLNESTNKLGMLQQAIHNITIELKQTSANLNRGKLNPSEINTLIQNMDKTIGKLKLLNR